MKVHKDKIIFREKFLNTEEGKMKQTENESWKKLKEDINNNGIINPLICTEKDGKYRLCIGMRRFIAGLILGIEEYEIEVVSDEEVKTLRNATAKYQTKHKDGTDITL
jgi:ParB-like chromosome segregation protein Spo0J